MNSGSIDQDTVSPFDAAHAEDLQRLRDRESEEKWACLHSMPTRVLGWMLIGGCLLQFVAGFMNSGVDLGGLVYLIAGICVLRGSQAALRFVVFFCAGVVPGLIQLAWNSFQLRPILVDDVWYPIEDIKFWTLGVSPLVYFLGEFILGVLALRTRRVIFWTKTVKVSATVFGVLLLLGGAIAVQGWMRKRSVEKGFPAEIAAARSYIESSAASTVSGTSMRSAESLFSSYPRVVEVTWKSDMNSNLRLYHRGLAATDGLSTGEVSHRHSQLVRDHSGKWGEVELELIQPGKP